MAPSRTGSPRTLSAARSLLPTRSLLRGDAAATDDALGRPRAAAAPLPEPAPAEDGPQHGGRPPAAPPLPSPGFARPGTAPGGATALAGQGRGPVARPAATPNGIAATAARGGRGGTGTAGRLAPAGEQPAEPAHAAAPFNAWPAAAPPPFPPQRTPAPPAGTAGEPSPLPAVPQEASTPEPLGAPQMAPKVPSAPSADKLFDPRGQLTDRAVAALVDTAGVQARNPQYDGTPGRRPVGTGLWLAWDDAADAPAVQPSGGVLLLAAEDGDARIGVARDSASGDYLAWDLERNAPWPDANGNPIALPRDLVAAHTAAGGMSPLELATALVVEHELRALAEADQESLPGRVASMNALLPEIARGDHPLFDLYAPFVTTVEEMLPQTAGAAQWLRVTERRNARAILDQFLRLLDAGIEDPARLGEIVDPARARSGGDPTKASLPTSVSEAVLPSTVGSGAGVLGTRVQIADSGEILTDSAADPAATPASSETMPSAWDDFAVPVERDEIGQWLTDTGIPLPLPAIESWVSQATASPVTGDIGTGIRSIGDQGLFLLWDETSGEPVRSESNGYLLGISLDSSGRYAVVRDTGLNILSVWDVRAGQILGSGGSSPHYLRPTSGLSLVLPPRVFELLQAGMLEAIAFSNSRSTQEFQSAKSHLEDLIEETEGLGGIYGPVSHHLSMVHYFLMQHYIVSPLTAEGTISPEMAVQLQQYAVEILSPDRLAAQIDTATASEPGLLTEMLRRTTGIDAVVNPENDTTTFASWSGDPFFALPSQLANTFLTVGGGAPILDLLGNWRAGGISDHETAEALLALLPPSLSAEMTHEEALGSVQELGDAIQQGGKQLEAASKLLALATVDNIRGSSDASMVYEIIQAVLEFAPITGNMLSAAQAFENAQVAFDAIETGDYDEAAIFGLLAVVDTIGAVPGIGTLAQVASKALVRTLWRIPGVDRMFIRRGMTAPAVPNKLNDVFTPDIWTAVPRSEIGRLRAAVNRAIGEAGERYAALRLNTFTRHLDLQSHHDINVGPRAGRQTFVDIESGQSAVGRFVSGLGFSVSDRVLYEIKTGAADLTANQRAYREIIQAQSGGDAYKVLRVPLREIPTDILHELMREHLLKKFSAQQAEEIIAMMQRQLPDLRVVDAMDYIARVIAAPAHATLEQQGEVSAP
jgi:hypothetical protein